MSQDLSFIEVQFPVSKISKESYKERKAVQGQTLTGLGKWWGRKPLILVRATILGMLMPATDDPKKDREIYLKVLMMDNDGLLKRKNKLLSKETILENITFKDLKNYFEVPIDLFSTETNPNRRLKKAEAKDLEIKASLSSEQKSELQKIAYLGLSYDDKLEYALRSEETKLEDENSWQAINEHLGTNATNLQEVVQQLGFKKYGYVPTVGDCFAGGGSIPFEAARMGLNSFGSDLNPVAGLLTWAALNINGASNEEVAQLREFQGKVYNEARRIIDEWGLERNEKGWLANAYLYCFEASCPECNYSIPLSSTWQISAKNDIFGLLVKDEVNKTFQINIKENATKEEIALSESQVTIENYCLKCPNCRAKTPIPVIRKDQSGEHWNDYRYSTKNDLRFWSKTDYYPKPNDIYRERLYCIRYEQTVIKKGKPVVLRHYVAPDENDILREQKVLNVLKENFVSWQDKGYIPEDEIKPGFNTNQLTYEKGWKYWGNLYNHRQILVTSLLLKCADELASSNNERLICLLGVNKCIDWNSKLSVWDNGNSPSVKNLFYNQSFNTLFNYSTRGLSLVESIWFFNINNYPATTNKNVTLADARTINKSCDFWITDPPYADAVHYHELSELFLAWDRKFIQKCFPEWYTDSKRVLAVKGTGEDFNQSMIEIYRNLAKNMPDNGMQVVMFTHQSPAVWADLTLILWSAGLHVTAAWNIATETESGGLKEGNYVKGTVILVLRKRTTSATAFTDEITFEIQEEVKQQIDSMRTLEDKEDPNFSDADYLLAAYAATLKILTSYEKIGDINVEYELSKPRDGKNIGPVEAIINNAIRTAYDYLIPQAFDSFIWKNLSAEERFFIKGMELEKSNVYQLGAYQEMARGFGVKEFKEMLFSTKANQVRFKTPSEYGNRGLGNADAFGNTLLRQVLMSIAQSEKEQNGQAGRAWLKNEVEDYWNKRQTIIELLKYFSTTEHIDHMQHWESPSTYAKYLVELISNDGV
jgi:adenine-specific DNA methylase